MNTNLFLLLCVLPLFVMGQQIPDQNFSPEVNNPTYEKDRTAIIGIDNTHNNLHTLEGGFAPFAKLLSADGYQLENSRISGESLARTNIFIIVNPLHITNIGNWKRPILPAFEQEEIDALENWVADGGSLLVIADHMPFAGATNSLAKKFGFEYADGFVMGAGRLWPPDSYSKATGNLYQTALTKNIDSLAGFTGSALIAPSDAIAVAGFPKTHQLLIPEVAWQFEENTEKLSAEGYVLGAYKTYGKGKVAFFTEAAMFTAQIVQDRFKVGMNSPMAPQNQQFALNLVHWLDSGKTIPRPSTSDDAYATVNTLLSAQAQVYEKNDMQGVADFYTNDGIIYEPTGEELRGMESISAYWANLSGKAIAWDYQILEVEQIGDQILAICYFEISFQQSEEKVFMARSKAILTFKKEEGQFKIHRDFYMPMR